MGRILIEELEDGETKQETEYGRCEKDSNDREAGRESFKHRYLEVEIERR